MHPPIPVLEESAAVPHAPCPGCAEDVAIDLETCPVCGHACRPRLRSDSDPGRGLPPRLWFGLLMPASLIGIVQILLGLLVGHEVLAPAWMSDSPGWGSRLVFIGPALLSVIAGAIPVVLLSMGPAIIAAGQLSAFDRHRTVTGRFRWIAAFAAPLSLVSAVPLLGVVPAMLAADPAGRRPHPRIDPADATCPNCDYALPEARGCDVVRCPECGDHCRWMFVRSLLARDRWLAGLVGAVGLVLMPIMPAIFRLPMQSSLAVALQIGGAAVGIAMIVRLRAGWNHQRWRPSVAWALMASVPFLLSILVGFVAGLS